MLSEDDKKNDSVEHETSNLSESNADLTPEQLEPEQLEKEAHISEELPKNIPEEPVLDQPLPEAPTEIPAETKTEFSTEMPVEAPVEAPTEIPEAHISEIPPATGSKQNAPEEVVEQEPSKKLDEAPTHAAIDQVDSVAPENPNNQDIPKNKKAAPDAIPSSLSAVLGSLKSNIFMIGSSVTLAIVVVKVIDLFTSKDDNFVRHITSLKQENVTQKYNIDEISKKMITMEEAIAKRNDLAEKLEKSEKSAKKIAALQDKIQRLQSDVAQLSKMKEMLDAGVSKDKIAVSLRETEPKHEFSAIASQILQDLDNRKMITQARWIEFNEAPKNAEIDAIVISLKPYIGSKLFNQNDLVEDLDFILQKLKENPKTHTISEEDADSDEGRLNVFSKTWKNLKKNIKVAKISEHEAIVKEINDALSHLKEGKVQLAIEEIRSISPAYRDDFAPWLEKAGMCLKIETMINDLRKII